jgi:hypothetical protein
MWHAGGEQVVHHPERQGHLLRQVFRGQDCHQVHQVQEHPHQRRGHLQVYSHDIVDPEGYIQDLDPDPTFNFLNHSGFNETMHVLYTAHCTVYSTYSVLNL